ncbi:MAG: hypothetical protein A3K09_07005 [Nitrospinae bacterium RIFCSPLOWO2_12_FULL_47_7]|nr:MAG: hypothetical protein A3K09_07005 [Nitrospinae bacterium RIFCSPLOWO2_12_FULL_47_7]
MGGLTVLLLPMTALALTAASPKPAADFAAGEKIYVNTCQVCHGERGDGQTFVANALTPPPRNFASEASRKELTRARMIRSVTHGRPGTAMMPWKDRLGSGEIRAVIAFIRSQFMGLRE